MAHALIRSDMKVGEVLDRFPSTIDTFVAHGKGLNMLRSDKLRQMFAYKVTVAQGARLHMVDVEALVRDLNETAARDVQEGRAAS